MVTTARVRTVGLTPSKPNFVRYNIRSGWRTRARPVSTRKSLPDSGDEQQRIISQDTYNKFRTKKLY